MITSRRYRIFQKHYGTKEGIEAIAFYVLAIALMFLQGYINRQDLDKSVIPWVQIAFPVLEILIVLIVMRVSKQKLKTIGITKRLRLKSILWGVGGAFLLTCLLVISKIVLLHGSVDLKGISLIYLLQILVVGIANEMIFRGYIETRLSGLVKNRILCSFVVAAMFLIIYVPVRGIAMNVRLFGVMTGFNIASLIAIHYFCDYIYRKQNCLYGSVILNVIFGIGTMTLVV